MTHHYKVFLRIEELDNETRSSTGIVDSVEITYPRENANLPPWRSALSATELYEQTRRQIAAAPDLLAALKQCLDALYNETYGCDSPWIETVKQSAIDAITKAERGNHVTKSKLYRCANCDFETDDEQDLDQISGGLFERVSAGEIYPAGECPECGALCHIYSKQVRLLDAAPEMMEVLRDIIVSKGCSPCGTYTYVDSRKIARARSLIAQAERE